MLTKQERDAIRARCEAATPGEWKTPPSFSGITTQKNGDIVLRCHQNKNTVNDMLFICNAREDISALLVALEDAEDKIVFWQGEYNKAWDDRNRWKARSEALERAIHRQPTCYTCEYFFTDNNDSPCDDCDHESEWQFDEARFLEPPKEVNHE